MTNRLFKPVVFALVLLIAFAFVAFTSHWATAESDRAVHAQEMMKQAGEYETRLNAQQTEFQEQIKTQEKKLDDSRAEYFYFALYNACYVKAIGSKKTKNPSSYCLDYIQDGYRLRAHSFGPKPGWDWDAVKSNTAGQIR